MMEMRRVERLIPAGLGLTLVREGAEAEKVKKFSIVRVPGRQAQGPPAV